ncbi:MAG: HAMP domain-containing protein [Anaerolineae bacterium]|nr:HAMP domain-containing protein [Anaerolineae bacterium]
MFRYIQRIVSYVSSRIRLKIILPFALLTLMVAVTGTYLSTRLVAGSLEERFTGQLFEAGKAVADGLAQREQLHLSTARVIAFTTGIDESLLSNNQTQLQNLLFPIMVNNNIDRVDMINADGLPLLAIHRTPGTNAIEDYMITTANLADMPIVNKVLQGVVDARGDKYTTLATIDGYEMLLTAGPVKQEDQIIGVVLVGSYIQNLLNSFKQIIFTDVSLYDLEGQLIGTTIPGGGETPAALAMTPTETRLLLALEGETSPQKSISVGENEYDLIYSIFWARGAPLGFYSVATPTTFIVSQGTNARNQMVIIFTTALLMVFGIGYVMSSRITGRLHHLMENAMAVADGDFTRRTQISTNDEIGSLARSLDYMTESLANYTHALQDKIDELITLHESSTAVTIKSNLNLDQVLQAIIASVRGVIRNTDQVIIYLLDEKNQTLIPKASAPQAPHSFPMLAFGEQNGERGLLAATRPQVISVSNLASYSPGAFSANGITDILVTSLIAGQEIIGMLIFTPAGNQPPAELLNKDSERLLRTLANQAAIAIKNAQLFEATQRAYQELQQLDDLKTEFINIAAHELRTPLGAMMGYASFAQKRVPPNLQKTMNFLVVSTLRMRTMVDAMLTIQRLDAGKAFLRLNSVDIQKTIRKTVTDFQPMAELAGHIIVANLPDELPPIEADAEKIDLIFSNLLSNAIKFTPEDGHIQVTLQDYGESILLSVRDNGVGIAKENQERIFERFYQVRVAHLAGHSGMGIGLTTVKHLVELHGGQVWVESEVGQGSTFFITLPKTTADNSRNTPALTSAEFQLIEPETSVIPV